MVNTPLKRILIVDDEIDMRKLITTSLEIMGEYSVVECEDGTTAIELTREVQPDLILMDVMMPDADGPAILSKLRKSDDLADIPIIFTTAQAGPADIEYYKKLGALDVIAKPFKPMELSKEIQAIWDRTHA